MVTCPKSHTETLGWTPTRSSAMFESAVLPEPVSAEIHPTAVIGENVQIGVGTTVMAHVVIADDVQIGNHVIVYPGCYIGHDCSIGDRTVLQPCVVLREGSQVGEDVFIDSGAVVGSDGFGFTPNKETGRLEKVPQVGIVVIKDGARIGAGAALDRATMGKTVIGENSVVGDLAQVAHNVVIGKDSAIGPQAGICGSTCIGSRVEIGQRAGVVGHIKINDGAKIDAGTGISKDVPAGAVLGGWPSVPRKEQEEREQLQNQLPDLFKRVRELEKRVH